MDFLRRWLRKHHVCILKALCYPHGNDRQSTLLAPCGACVAYGATVASCSTEFGCLRRCMRDRYRRLLPNGMIQTQTVSCSPSDSLRGIRNLRAELARKVRLQHARAWDRAFAGVGGAWGILGQAGEALSRR
jgi:hypothetical protein